MTDLTAQQIEELERLEAAATPGDWRAFETYTGEEGAFEVGPGEFDTVAHVRQGNDELTGDAKSNAAFIAAIRNAAKPLLAMVKRLREENAKLISDGHYTLANDLVAAQMAVDQQASEIADLRRQLAERDAEIERWRAEADQNSAGRYRQALYIVANSGAQSGDLIAKYAQERLMEIDDGMETKGQSVLENPTVT